MLKQWRHSSSLSQGLCNPVGSEGEGDWNGGWMAEEVLRPTIKRDKSRIQARSQNCQKTICNAGPQGVMHQNTFVAEFGLQRSGNRCPPVRPCTKEGQHGKAGTTVAQTIANGRNIGAHVRTGPKQKGHKPDWAVGGSWNLVFSCKHVQLNGGPTNALQLIGKCRQTHGDFTPTTAVHYQAEGAWRTLRRAIP